MDDNMKVSSFVCAMAFSQLMGSLAGKGIMAGVKKTPGSIIPRLAILAVVESSMLLCDGYSKWCYEVGDAFASKFRKGWYLLVGKDEDQEKVLKEEFEEISDK